MYLFITRMGYIAQTTSVIHIRNTVKSIEYDTYIRKMQVYGKTIDFM